MKHCSTAVELHFLYERCYINKVLLTYLLNQVIKNVAAPMPISVNWKKTNGASPSVAHVLVTSDSRKKTDALSTDAG